MSIVGWLKSTLSGYLVRVYRGTEALNKTQILAELASIQADRLLTVVVGTVRSRRSWLPGRCN